MYHFSEPNMSLAVLPHYSLHSFYQLPTIHATRQEGIHWSITDNSINQSSIHSFICLSVHPSIPVHLSIYLSIYLSIHPSIHPHPSVYLCIYPSIYSSIPIHPSIYASIHPFIHPSASICPSIPIHPL